MVRERNQNLVVCFTCCHTRLPQDSLRVNVSLYQSRVYQSRVYQQRMYQTCVPVMCVPATPGLLQDSLLYCSTPWMCTYLCQTPSSDSQVLTRVLVASSPVRAARKPALLWRETRMSSEERNSCSLQAHSHAARARQPKNTHRHASSHKGHAPHIAPQSRRGRRVRARMLEDLGLMLIVKFESCLTCRGCLVRPPARPR